MGLTPTGIDPMTSMYLYVSFKWMLYMILWLIYYVGIFCYACDFYKVVYKCLKGLFVMHKMDLIYW